MGCLAPCSSLGVRSILTRSRPWSQALLLLSFLISSPPGSVTECWQQLLEVNLILMPPDSHQLPTSVAILRYRSTISAPTCRAPDRWACKLSTFMRVARERERPAFWSSLQAFECHAAECPEDPCSDVTLVLGSMTPRPHTGLPSCCPRAPLRRFASRSAHPIRLHGYGTPWSEGSLRRVGPCHARLCDLEPHWFAPRRSRGHFGWHSAYTLRFHVRCSFSIAPTPPPRARLRCRGAYPRSSSSAASRWHLRTGVF